jgi:hypothetical protein
MQSPHWPESRVTFHKHWTAAVGGPAYNKKTWQALEKRYDAAYKEDNAPLIAKILEEAKKLEQAHTRPL